MSAIILHSLARSTEGYRGWLFFTCCLNPSSIFCVVSLEQVCPQSGLHHPPTARSCANLLARNYRFFKSPFSQNSCKSFGCFAGKFELHQYILEECCILYLFIFE